MEKNHSSYRQIFKATSLFGGVQVFNILILVVRSKAIALLLGPSGMGIFGLLSATLTFISSLTNFGLGISAVRNVAAANESGDTIKIAKVTTVLRKLVWITGTLGLLVTLILSSWLSQITFGNTDYTIAFVWLSISLLFNQLTIGQNVLLQGMRQLQYLAKANIIGSAVGLLVSLPLYYFYNIDGIVPAIIITSACIMLIARYFATKIKTQAVSVDLRETVIEGKSMLQTGMLLSLSGLITVGASYIVNIYISNIGGSADVGLYNAGFAIINTYVGLVFTAMATDYYPRLSGVANSRLEANELINNQAEVAILILAPILCIFLIFINWVIILLYSSEFLPINDMIQWAALGMYFKAVSWSIAFLFLAKGNSKLFFWSELIANAYLLLFNIFGYQYFGLAGLGISFLAGYVIYLLQVYFITKKRYQFLINRDFYKIFSIQFLLGLICFLLIKFMPITWAYLLGVFFIALSIWYSFNEMDKRIGLMRAFNNFRKKKNGG